MSENTTNTTEAYSNQQRIENPEIRSYTMHRRFDRFGRLVGDAVMEKLAKSHAMIIGVGGVGSFAAEALARSAVGTITLVDFDEVCVTNTNRQLHALVGQVGKKKATIMAERLQKINPQAKIHSIEKFYNAFSSEEILGSKPDLVLDCADNITAKCHLLATCVEKKIPVICAGGASAKQDPLRIKFTDLGKTHTDPFLVRVRKILRQQYNFPADGAMNIPTVFSDEAPQEPFELKYDNGEGFKCVCPQGQNDFHSCDDRNMIYGTASYVTGAFGLVMASRAIAMLKQEPPLAETLS